MQLLRQLMRQYALYTELFSVCFCLTAHLIELPFLNMLMDYF